MGFDQYHEPPEELPAATRTFARLCASLTEEAEAIGWYQQRLAVESDPEAIAVMRDAQGEEFKHFSMDLELLLRRTPSWREVAQGILFQPGDVVEHAEQAEAEAFEGGGRGRGRRLRRLLARHRQPEGGTRMNHLLREHAPLSDAGWQLLDDEARERLAPALGARRLVDFSGPHGWEHSASSVGRVKALPARPGEGRLRAAPRGAARWSSCVRTSRSPALSCATPTAARRTRTSARSTRRRARSPRPRTSRCSTGGRGRSPASPSARRTMPVALGAADGYPRPVADAVEKLLCEGVGGPYGLALGRKQYRRVVETAEGGGYPLLDHLRKILEGPIVWTPGIEGAVVVSLRGGDFLFESGQDLSIGYDSHDADVVRLYLQESFSFRVATPEAAVTLTP